MQERDVLVRLAATRDRRAIAGADAQIAVDLHRRETVDAAIAARRCWVAERMGAVVGYGVMTRNFFGRDFVEMLHVAESARRRGIGDAILETIERGRSSDRIFTSTNESNAAMRALLSRRDYQQSGMILNLDPGDPELVFVKHLRG
jgi:ribosomal protein S18 acetylase RimI-like enzyme